MPSSASQSWTAYYEGGNADKPLVPESFVARVFLSQSPVRLLRDYRFAGRTILDLGCGEGRHAAFFSRLGFAVSCCEVSPRQVERLRRRFPDFDVRCCTAEGLVFDDATFDVVAAINAIYYLDADTPIERHLGEAGRVLKPGGVLVASFVGARHFILHGCTRHADGSATIARDPLAFRRGTRLRPVWDRADLESLLVQGGTFDVHRIGEITDTCQGLTRHLHYAVAYRR